MKNKRGQIQEATAHQEPVAQPEKKSRWWLWLIIALVLIGIGIWMYFALFRGSSV